MKLKPTTVRMGMAVFVTVLWAVGYLVAIIEQNYDGVIPATPVMIVAAAYLFGAGSAEYRRGGSGKREENGN